MSKTALAALVVLALAGTLYASYIVYGVINQPVAVVQTQQVHVPAVPRELEFKLTDSQGEAFSDDDLEGRVWVASVFFTSCPHMCVQMNQKLAELSQEVTDEELGLLSFTCNPDMDTPQVLADYKKHWGFGAEDDRWKFLTGDLEEIVKLGRDALNMAVGREVHSQRVVVVDRDGYARESYKIFDPIEYNRLKKRIGELLEMPAEGKPSSEEKKTPEKVAAGKSSDVE